MVLLYVLLISSVGYPFFRKVLGYDPPTAYYSWMPRFTGHGRVGSRPVVRDAIARPRNPLTYPDNHRTHRANTILWTGTGQSLGPQSQSRR